LHTSPHFGDVENGLPSNFNAASVLPDRYLRRMAKTRLEVLYCSPDRVAPMEKVEITFAHCRPRHDFCPVRMNYQVVTLNSTATEKALISLALVLLAFNPRSQYTHKNQLISP
jgi:hypothetical protein